MTCRTTLLAALVAAAGATGCAPSPQAVDRRACATEAVLLGAGAELREAPDPRAAVRLRLPAGHPVYLCGEPIRGYRGLIHPVPGQRARCSDEPEACPEGWLPADTPTQLAG